MTVDGIIKAKTTDLQEAQKALNDNNPLNRQAIIPMLGRCVNNHIGTMYKAVTVVAVYWTGHGTAWGEYLDGGSGFSKCHNWPRKIEFELRNNASESELKKYNWKCRNLNVGKLGLVKTSSECRNP